MNIEPCCDVCHDRIKRGQGGYLQIKEMRFRVCAMHHTLAQDIPEEQLLPYLLNSPVTYQGLHVVNL